MKISYDDFQQAAIKKYLKLDKYAYLILNITNYEQDKVNYENVYCDFYAINAARRNSEWKKNYFEVFAEARKNPKLTFANVLTALVAKCPQYFDPSFASKILATINPTKPVWDNFVIRNLINRLDTNLLSKDNDHYYVKGKTIEEKIANAVKIYDSLEKIEKDLLKNPQIQMEITKFRKNNQELIINFFHNQLTDLKILDFYLWMMRQ